MVCLTHANYFLSDEGMTHFSGWFKNVTQSLVKQPGFISICYAQDPNDQSSMHVWIEFKDQNYLSSWLSSQNYVDIYKILDTYKTRPHLTTHFDVIDAVSASA
jgi:heme-degrading monooxygenase HmoA